MIKNCTALLLCTSRNYFMCINYCDYQHTLLLLLLRYLYHLLYYALFVLLHLCCHCLGASVTVAVTLKILRHFVYLLYLIINSQLNYLNCGVLDCCWPYCASLCSLIINGTSFLHFWDYFVINSDLLF